jgi:hypothetical protein
MAPEKKLETSGSDGFLATVEARIAALQQLKESYLAAVSVGAFGPGGDIDISSIANTTARGSAYDLPTGALLGKSVPQAIKLYLGAVRKKQTATEIMNALKEGGVESTAANFLNNVTSSLHRLKTAGHVLQFKDGWALAEFYPESLRARIAKDAEPKKKPAKGKRKKATRPADRPVEARAAVPKEPPQPGLEQRITTYLQTRATEFTSVHELVAQLKVAAPVINLSLGKMAKAGKVEKAQDGRVRLAKKAA